MVQIFLIAVIARHALQRLDLACDIGALIDGALLDARVELGAVGRAAAATCRLVRQISVVLVADVLIELTQQEIHAHLLVALEALDGLRQIGDGLLGFLSLDMVVGKGGIGQCTHLFVGNLVKVDVGKHVVGLGGPAHSAIAQGLTHLALLHQICLPGEVTCDIAEGGSGIQEVALHVLRLGEQVPGIVQIGVVLVTGEPFLVLRVTALATFALGFLLDGVQCDGLFHLFDGAVKTAAGLRSLRVGTRLGRMHIQMLRVVVLIGVHHRFQLLVIVGLAVKIDVIFGSE